MIKMCEGVIGCRPPRIVDWNAAAEVFPVVMPILQFETYQYHALSGVIISVGGLTESIVRHSSASFQQFVDDGGGVVKMICSTCINCR